MARKNKPKPSAGSVPTYIRFTSDQLIAMDEATKGLVVTDINEIRRLLNSITTKSIGIDWGNISRWTVCGMTAAREPVLIRTGSWDDPNEMVEFGRDRKAKSGATSAIERELEEQAYHMAARRWPDAHIIQDSLINHPTIQGDYFLINPPFSMQLEQKNIPLENAGWGELGPNSSIQPHIAALEVWKDAGTAWPCSIVIYHTKFHHYNRKSAFVRTITKLSDLDAVLDEWKRIPHYNEALEDLNMIRTQSNLTNVVELSSRLSPSSQLCLTPSFNKLKRRWLFHSQVHLFD